MCKKGHRYIWTKTELFQFGNEWGSLYLNCQEFKTGKKINKLKSVQQQKKNQKTPKDSTID